MRLKDMQTVGEWLNGQYVTVGSSVCVCVCERERERESRYTGWLLSAMYSSQPHNQARFESVFLSFGPSLE